MNTQHDIYETAHRANIAKLQELAELADEKSEDQGTAERGYWIGVRDGLRRAIGVLEGRG